MNILAGYIFVARKSYFLNTRQAEGIFRKETHLPWWPSCLDCSALINVDAPVCGTSVDRGLTGHK